MANIYIAGTCFLNIIPMNWLLNIAWLLLKSVHCFRTKNENLGQLVNGTMGNNGKQGIPLFP